jgi:hypothetical protein
MLPAPTRGIAANGDARRIDRAAASPHVAADADRPAVLPPGFLPRRVLRMADPRRSPMGHEERFPRRRLSGRCGFRKQSVAVMTRRRRLLGQALSLRVSATGGAVAASAARRPGFSSTHHVIRRHRQALLRSGLQWLASHPRLPAAARFSRPVQDRQHHTR